MPFPAAHVIINFFVIYPFRKHLGKYWLPVALLSGLIPDFDSGFEILGKLFNFDPGILAHGGFFHSIGFVLLLGILSFIIYKQDKECGGYFLILTIGVLVHILIDLILGGGGYSFSILYPFTNEQFRIHLLEPWKENDIYGILDAFLIFILSLWMIWKIKIKDLK
jgi:hypothetical protein